MLGSAQFLLRFDDICPTMNWKVWAQIEELLTQQGVRPILAVVPDNRDHKLRVGESNSLFWEETRKWQSWGWAIGLHGYQHSYVTSDAGIVGLNRYSEFAGLSLPEQTEKIRRGVSIFSMNGVTPDLWIAPAHSFDANTLKALLEHGIRTVSDGFFLYPNADAHGIFWIPQQLWDFRPMKIGVWTVCLHHNDWGEADIRKLGEDLARYKDRITNIDAVATTYRKRTRGLLDLAFPLAFRMSLRLRGLARAVIANAVRV